MISGIAWALVGIYNGCNAGELARYILSRLLRWNLSMMGLNVLNWMEHGGVWTES